MKCKVYMRVWTPWKVLLEAEINGQRINSDEDILFVFQSAYDTQRKWNDISQSSWGAWNIKVIVTTGRVAEDIRYVEGVEKKTQTTQKIALMKLNAQTVKETTWIFQILRHTKERGWSINEIWLFKARRIESIYMGGRSLTCLLLRGWTQSETAIK